MAGVVIVLGCAAGCAMPTANVCAVDEPHALLATTVIFPPEAPTGVAVMLFVVEVPVQVAGRVHV